MRITIFANSFHSISGGDVIFVELAKGWMRLGATVTVITNSKGAMFCKARGLPSHCVRVWQSSWTDVLSIGIAQAHKTAVGVVRGIFFDTGGSDIVFSMSDFWPDVLPAVIAKIKNPSLTWVAACYLLMPQSQVNTGHRSSLTQVFLRAMQKTTIFFIRRFTDSVFTAADSDRRVFFNAGRLNTHSVMKIRGGVDIRLAESVRTHSTRYDGVFVGRFHEQKNIIELLTIWRMVLRTIPSVRLGLVGAGPLERELKTFVANAGMTKNIFFLGVRDGQDKYGILKSSKVFLSASLTDSGNIALDEALSCGVPGIVFNLSRLDYPAGVVKIPIGNKDKFVHAILRLLRNPAERSRLGREGRSFIRRYDWSATSRDTYALLRGIKKEIH